MAEPEDTAPVNQVPAHGPGFIEPGGGAQLDQLGGVHPLTGSSSSGLGGGYFDSVYFESPYFGSKSSGKESYAGMVVGASVFANGTVFTRVSSQSYGTTFPSYASDLVELTISNTPVVLSDPTSLVSPTETCTTCCFVLNNLEVDLDGKVLTFSEILLTDTSTPKYSLEEWVTLQFDLGDGMYTFFRGKIREQTRTTDRDSDVIEYSAHGVMRVADDIEAIGEDGDGFYIGNIDSPTTITVGSSTYVLPAGGHPTVRQAVQAMFTSASSALQANTISTSLDLSGIPEGVYIDGNTRISGGFSSAIKTVLAAAPGIRHWYDDDAEEWKFFDVFAAPVWVVDASSVCPTSFNHTKSSEGRYTAYNLAARDGLLGMSKTTVSSVYPAWDPDYEENWTHASNATDRDNEFKFVNEQLEKVYREFLIDIPVGNVRQAADVKLHYKINGDPSDIYGWHTVDATIELRSTQPNSNGLTSVSGPLFTPTGPVVGQLAGNALPNPYAVVRVEDPIVTLGNPNVPGDAYGPIFGIVVTYFTPQPIELSQIVRYPPSGYAGTAFTEAGIQRERYEVVELGQATFENAYRKLLPLMHIKRSGSIPIYGNPMKEMMNMNARVSVVHPTVVTGMEDGQVMLSGYSYDFLGNESTLSYDNDLTRFIESGT